MPTTAKNANINARTVTIKNDLYFVEENLYFKAKTITIEGSIIHVGKKATFNATEFFCIDSEIKAEETHFPPYTTIHATGCTMEEGSTLVDNFSFDL